MAVHLLMKKKLKYLLWTVIGIGFLFALSAHGATLQGFQGGTGFATSTSGNDSNCLKQSSSTPFLVWTIGSCGSGGGGGTTTINGFTSSTFQLNGTANQITVTQNPSGTLTFSLPANLVITNTSSTNSSVSGFFTVGGQTTLASASTTNLSVSGYGLFPTLNFTNSSGTNISVTGYGIFPTLSYTNASGTNEDLIGRFTVAQTSTFKSTVSSTIASALWLAGANGTVSAYAGTGPCTTNQFMTTLSAVGGQSCGAVTFPFTTSTALANTQVIFVTAANTIGSSANFTYTTGSGVLSAPTTTFTNETISGVASDSQLFSASTTFTGLTNALLSTNGGSKVVASTFGAGVQLSGGQLSVNEDFQCELRPDNAILPNISFPSAGRTVGTTVSYSWLGFTNATTTSAYWICPLPTNGFTFNTTTIDWDFTSTSTSVQNISLVFSWNAVPTSTLIDKAFANTTSVTSTYSSTTASIQMEQSLNLTSTTFTSSSALYFQIKRTGAGDALTKDMQFVGAVLRFW